MKTNEMAPIIGAISNLMIVAVNVNSAMVAESSSPISFNGLSFLALCGVDGGESRVEVLRNRFESAKITRGSARKLGNVLPA